MSPQCQESIPRRTWLLSGLALTDWMSGQQAAEANPFQDLIVSRVRPELEKDEAIVMLMDAKGTLTELRDLAATSTDSKERFNARNRLPGMAKRLREVGPAAPVVAAAVSGNLREAGVSRMYGGQGGLEAATDAVYSSIGRVITISGRTIRKEAQASPLLADQAISHIDDLLTQLPATDSAKGQQARMPACVAVSCVRLKWVEPP
ncbi:hypothetical protein WJX84_003926 [Apatococcus fuscideae]|uniref:Uncharacterized protein n=1 Tax=Apatococcus fuscideae TaxID=2026836 RepID=A0AAW1T1Q6_9CHLO